MTYKYILWSKSSLKMFKNQQQKNLKWRARTKCFLTVFWFFDRDFGPLGIEISKIRFQIRIPGSLIILNPNFRLIAWKIADFKRNCCFFQPDEDIPNFTSIFVYFLCHVSWPNEKRYQPEIWHTYSHWCFLFFRINPREGL